MIAVDSPVLIELLSDGPRADAVEACLRQALVGGRVVVCGTTLAELCAALRGGAGHRIGEFMVGAHAMLQCDGLVTWNDAFYRDYFKGLKLIVPQA